MNASFAETLTKMVESVNQLGMTVEVEVDRSAVSRETEVVARCTRCRWVFAPECKATIKLADWQMERGNPYSVYLFMKEVVSRRCACPSVSAAPIARMTIWQRIRSWFLRNGVTP